MDTNLFLAVLAFISFVFAIIGGAGSWRAARSSSALAQYREVAKAWEEKSGAQAMQLTDLREDAHRKEAKIAELEGKVTVLQDSLSGRAAWEVLQIKIGEVLQLGADIRAEVRQLHEETRAEMRRLAEIAGPRP